MSCMSWVNEGRLTCVGMWLQRRQWCYPQGMLTWMDSKIQQEISKSTKVLLQVWSMSYLDGIIDKVSSKLQSFINLRID